MFYRLPVARLSFISSFYPAAKSKFVWSREEKSKDRKVEPAVRLFFIKPTQVLLLSLSLLLLL